MKRLAYLGWPAFALLLVAFIHTEAHRGEVAAERERLGNRYQDCKCKSAIQRRELIASMCQAPTILGPWEHVCEYRAEQENHNR